MRANIQGGLMQRVHCRACSLPGLPLVIGSYRRLAASEKYINERGYCQDKDWIHGGSLLASPASPRIGATQPTAASQKPADVKVILHLNGIPVSILQFVRYRPRPLALKS